MSYFDHLAGLVKYNSHATPKSFKPLSEQHWPDSLIDDMISREISVLGLHRASMRLPIVEDMHPGRTALARLQPQTVLPATPPPQTAAGDHKTVIFAKDMDDEAFEVAAKKLVMNHGGHGSFMNFARRVKVLRLIAKSLPKV